MKKITVPNEVKEMMQIIVNLNYQCYLVGGTVRDLLLNVENKDYDFATNIPFNILQKQFPSIKIMKENNHRNTAILRKNGKDYEFSSFKGEDIYEDLQNRDFKMNAIAVGISGNIIDPYKGLDDIKNKKISLIKPKGEGLLHDPLRMLRAIRLKNQCQFKIDINTKKNIIKNSNLLNKVAPERIITELKQILISNSIEKDLLEYKNIFFELIPELKQCDGFLQYNDYHIYDVYTHIIKTVANVEADYCLRLASLFHDIGKPYNFKIDEKGIGHFLDHAKTSLKIFTNFAKKYKVDNKTKKIVSNLIIHHEDCLSVKPNKIYNFYKKYNKNDIELLFKLKRADIKAQNPKYLFRLSDLDMIEEKYLDVRNQLKDIKYNGYDLLKLGVENIKINIILDDIKINIINNKLKNDYKSINEFVEKKYIL